MDGIRVSAVSTIKREEAERAEPEAPRTQRSTVTEPAASSQPTEHPSLPNVGDNTAKAVRQPQPREFMLPLSSTDTPSQAGAKGKVLRSQARRQAELTTAHGAALGNGELSAGGLVRTSAQAPEENAAPPPRAAAAAASGKSAAPAARKSLALRLEACARPACAGPSLRGSMSCACVGMGAQSTSGTCTDMPAVVDKGGCAREVHAALPSRPQRANPHALVRLGAEAAAAAAAAAAVGSTGAVAPLRGACSVTAAAPKSTGPSMVPSHQRGGRKPAERRQAVRHVTLGEPPARVAPHLHACRNAAAAAAEEVAEDRGLTETEHACAAEAAEAIEAAEAMEVAEEEVQPTEGEADASELVDIAEGARERESRRMHVPEDAALAVQLSDDSSSLGSSLGSPGCHRSDPFGPTADGDDAPVVGEELIAVHPMNSTGHGVFGSHELSGGGDGGDGAAHVQGIPSVVAALWEWMGAALTRFGPHASFSLLVYAPEGDVVCLLVVLGGSLNMLWSMPWQEFRRRATATAAPPRVAVRAPRHSSHAPSQPSASQPSASQPYASPEQPQQGASLAAASDKAAVRAAKALPEGTPPLTVALVQSFGRLRQRHERRRHLVVPLLPMPSQVAICIVWNHHSEPHLRTRLPPSFPFPCPSVSARASAGPCEVVQLGREGGQSAPGPCTPWVADRRPGATLHPAAAPPHRTPAPPPPCAAACGLSRSPQVPLASPLYTSIVSIRATCTRVEAELDALLDAVGQSLSRRSEGAEGLLTLLHVGGAQHSASHPREVLHPPNPAPPPPPLRGRPGRLPARPGAQGGGGGGGVASRQLFNPLGALGQRMVGTGTGALAMRTVPKLRSLKAVQSMPLFPLPQAEVWTLPENDAAAASVDSMVDFE